MRLVRTVANVQDRGRGLPRVLAAVKVRLKALRKLPWYRFAAGVVAGAVGLGLTLLLRLFGLGVFLPEIAVDFAVGRIPGSIESFFIRTMGEGAKVLALTVALGIFLVLPGVYALPFRSLQARIPGRWTLMAVYSVVPAAIALLAILPLLNAGFFGSQTAAGPAATTFSQVMASFLSASVLDYFLVELAGKHPEGFSFSRRQFLISSAILGLSAVVAIYGLSTLISRPARLVFASVREMLDKEVTPTAEFYTVTKNLIDPEVDAGAWSLAIDGLVSSPATYAYGDLVARMDAEEAVTLECVSNEVGGNLISTARWRGLRLRDLLAPAGVDPTADWVALTCADGYTVGVPVLKAMNPSSLLALRMNDVTLPTRHGYPARVIVPGLYGMFHAKWVTRITLVRGEFLGYWQQKGWTNRGAIRTTAIIATPAHDTVVAGPVAVAIGGVAFAGDRGVSRVEVSTDGGSSWRDATLKAPPLSNLTWVLWTIDWTPPGGGSYRVVARAYDGAGNPQEASPAPPFSEGAAGYDSITLLVSG